ncbi:MMPL family transporter [Paractinoplanes atraurantiacus]|uniref:Putative drug exporter of the RND superfamily n=1 Tax=Paractinoplanes atraurantiacus TaxID=1036182 RepID=A0A285GPR2_9ACTN|nr:MMPL family transporter [Actinoplanes atraurantiacus]SNY25527.1 putative drug exporter of the RND superfamily [Actinoplanes atraurantiacus]
MVRLRWAVLGGWLVLAAVAILFTPPVSTGGLSGLVAVDSPPVQTEIRSFQRFGFPLLSRVAVVQRDPDGLSPLTQAEAVARAAATTQRQYDDTGPILGAIPIPNTGGVFPGSRENGTTIITLLFIPPNVGLNTQYAAAQRFAESHFGPEDAVVGVTGTLPARAAQGEVVEGSIKTVEMATLAAVLLVVGLAFRSVVAPLIALVTAGIAALVMLDLVGWLGWLLDVAVPTEVGPLLVALLLGVVTDYVVFYLFALRRELMAGHDRLIAARRATRSTTVIVVVAGLTVAAGTGVLLVAESPLFHAFGPGMALAVLVGLAVAVTLVPALLAILGPYAFWPGRHDRVPGQAARAARERRDRRTQWLVRRKPAAIVLTLGVLVLAVAALPARHLGLGLSFVSSLPADDQVRQAAVAARAGFADGIVSPTVLLLERPGITQDRSALDRLQRMLADRPGIAGVVGPADQPVPDELGLVLSRDGSAARYLLVLDSLPLGASGIGTLSSLRADLPRLLSEVGLSGVTAGLAGDTAVAADIVGQTTSDLERIIVATLVVNLLMLMLFLRALAAPVCLLLLNVLALAATLGLATLLFDTVLNHDGLTFYVPFAVAVLLVALGSDYNIFTVGQVWHEARTRPMRDAVVIALPVSARAVGTAAVILATSFGLLALVPLRPFAEIAFTMSVGVLLDALFLRSLLMPALLALLGDAAGWPGLRRRPPAGAELQRVGVPV